MSHAATKAEKLALSLPSRGSCLRQLLDGSVVHFLGGSFQEESRHLEGSNIGPALVMDDLRDVLELVEGLGR